LQSVDLFLEYIDVGRNFERAKGSKEGCSFSAHAEWDGVTVWPLPLPKGTKIIKNEGGGDEELKFGDQVGLKIKICDFLNWFLLVFNCFSKTSMREGKGGGAVGCELEKSEATFVNNP